MFHTISEISADDPTTWINRIFLSFDVDWAHDEIIQDTINLVENVGVSATWFVTHSSVVIDDLKKNNKFEVGIHPNFNNLLVGDYTNGSTVEEVIDRLLVICPGAISVRSHSLFQSERLFDVFSARGLVKISNVFIPGNVSAIPWRLWDRIEVIPHCWQDNASMRMDLDISECIYKRMSARVFDFHPIHVFLNTEDMSRYEKTRHLHDKPDELIKYRYKGMGTRTRLLHLLETNEQAEVHAEGAGSI